MNATHAVVAVCLVTLCLTSASLTWADAPNLAPNPGFEEVGENGAPSGWVADTAGMTEVVFARDTAEQHSGTASGRLTILPVDKPSWPAFAAKLPVQPGQCYQVTAWLKTREVVNLAYVATDYLDAQGNRVSFGSSPAVNGTSAGWSQVALRAVIPTGAVSMNVRLILYGSGVAWFDDVSVTRDEHAEQLAAKLAQPLPAEWLTRAITAEGDLSPLQRLFQSAARGGEYVVGVIGGSITQGAAASSPDQHYAAPVVRWLREHFPAAKFNFVNAGIGATGSNYGCLRVGRDLLAKRPDLVVIEYAVNDGPGQENAETYEGIVRQVLASPQHPAAIQLYFMGQAGNNSQDWQKRVGDQYHLPQVSYRALLWPEIEAKRMAWTDISPDTVHPNDLGHAYAGKLLIAVLDRALAGLPKDPVAAAAALPPPLFTDVYQHTTLQEADQIQPVSNDGWVYDAAHGWDKCWKSAKPGSVIEFELDGEQVFLSYWRIRGPMGRARISIDGGTPNVQEAWFDQTWGGYRQMIKLPAGGPGRHRVRVEVLPEKAADSTGNEFRVLCLGAAGVRP